MCKSFHGFLGALIAQLTDLCSYMGSKTCHKAAKVVFGASLEELNRNRNEKSELQTAMPEVDLSEELVYH